MRGIIGMLAMNLSPRCGAKTRPWNGGQPCKCPAMPNGRCRMHGGKSTGRRHGNGRYSKEKEEMRDTMRDLSKKLRKNRQIAETIIKGNIL